MDQEKWTIDSEMPPRVNRKQLEEIMGRKSQYTQEYMDSAVKMIIADGMMYASVSRKLGVSTAKLRTWVHKWKRESQLAHQHRSDNTLEELMALRQENEELKEANEILKKAAAYFAKSL